MFFGVSDRTWDFLFFRLEWIFFWLVVELVLGLLERIEWIILLGSFWFGDFYIVFLGFVRFFREDTFSILFRVYKFGCVCFEILGRRLSFWRLVCNLYWIFSILVLYFFFNCVYKIFFRVWDFGFCWVGRVVVF